MAKRDDSGKSPAASAGAKKTDAKAAAGADGTGRYRVETVSLEGPLWKVARRIDRIAAEGWRAICALPTFRDHDTLRHDAEMTTIRILFEPDPDGGSRAYSLTGAISAELPEVPRGGKGSLLDRACARSRKIQDLMFAPERIADTIAARKKRGESFVTVFPVLHVEHHDLRSSGKPLRRKGLPAEEIFEVREWPVFLFEKRRAKASKQRHSV